MVPTYQNFVLLRSIHTPEFVFHGTYFSANLIFLKYQNNPSNTIVFYCVSSYIVYLEKKDNFKYTIYSNLIITVKIATTSFYKFHLNLKKE